MNQTQMDRGIKYSGESDEDSSTDSSTDSSITGICLPPSIKVSSNDLH